jgi:hypothetical protein
MTVRRSNHSARSHPAYLYWLKPVVWCMARIVGVVAFRLLYHLVLEESEVPAEKSKQIHYFPFPRIFYILYLEVPDQEKECPPSRKSVN